MIPVLERRDAVIDEARRTAPHYDITAFDAQTAHGYVADRPLGNGTNGMSFSTGYGDGGYNLFVGLDADGRPTRYVLDCGLLHLAWPKVS